MASVRLHVFLNTQFCTFILYCYLGHGGEVAPQTSMGMPVVLINVLTRLYSVPLDGYRLVPIFQLVELAVLMVIAFLGMVLLGSPKD